jgi:hypothetical protein
MSRFLSILLLSLFLAVASTLSALATETTRPDAADRPIDLDIEVGELPVANGSRPGTVTARITPRVGFPNANLQIVAGGVLSIEPVSGMQPGDVRAPYFANLPVTSRLQRQLGPLTPGQPLPPETLNLRAAGAGQGYLAIAITSQVTSERTEPIVSTTLYVVSDGQSVHASRRGFMDAQVQELRSRGLAPDDVDRRIRELKRRGAKSSMLDTGIIPFSVEPIRSTATVTGSAMFTDRLGRQHPVRFAEIEVLELKGGAESQLAKSRTDAQGRYAVVFPVAPDAAVEVFVLLKASGETVRVVEYGTSDPWSVASATARAVRAGSRIVLDITASNDDTQANNIAFEVYEAVNYESRYLATLIGELPRLVTVNFPKPDDDGSFYSPQRGLLTLAGTDAHDWDNIHHEYGHHIQALFDLAASPGGSHTGSHNLCRDPDRGKDKGIRLAWGEGWPTFFGTMVQAELRLGRLGIPNVGDTSYTDTKPAGSPLEYDLEKTGSPPSVGEGNERAVQRVLWDLYDTNADPPDRVSVSAQELWNSVRTAKPPHFSHWWQSFMAGKSGKIVGQYGWILARHGFASRGLYPPDAATLKPGGADVEFRWSPANTCADSGSGQYSLRFYSDDLATVLFSSPFDAAESRRMTWDELKKIAGPRGHLTWAVVAQDLTPPRTGEFHGPFARARLQLD